MRGASHRPPKSRVRTHALGKIGALQIDATPRRVHARRLGKIGWRHPGFRPKHAREVPIAHANFVGQCRARTRFEFRRRNRKLITGYWGEPVRVGNPTLQSANELVGAAGQRAANMRCLRYGRSRRAEFVLANDALVSVYLMLHSILRRTSVQGAQQNDRVLPP